MFAGIITGTGTVVSLTHGDHAAVLQIRSEHLAPESGRPVELGESIAVSGVCLTAVSMTGDTVTFDVASETLRKTTLGHLTPGSTVNIERSLRFGDRVDGHLVQGHVDCVAEIVESAMEGETLRLAISLPDELCGLIAEKGAVAVDGVSLTVGAVRDGRFYVYVIPHTRAVTTLGLAEGGAKVNLEADMFARYVRETVIARDGASHADADRK